MSARERYGRTISAAWTAATTLGLIWIVFVCASFSDFIVAQQVIPVNKHGNIIGNVILYNLVNTGNPNNPWKVNVGFFPANGDMNIIQNCHLNWWQIAHRNDRPGYPRQDLQNGNTLPGNPGDDNDPSYYTNDDRANNGSGWPGVYANNGWWMQDSPGPGNGINFETSLVEQINNTVERLVTFNWGIQANGGTVTGLDHPNRINNLSYNQPQILNNSGFGNYWSDVTPVVTVINRRGGKVEIPKVAGGATIGFSFPSDDTGACYNVTLFAEVVNGTDTSWVQVRHWNFNGGKTRYYRPDLPNATGRYRLVNDSNRDELRVRHQWLPTVEPSTPSSTYSITSHSVGAVDESAIEFNPALTTGGYVSIIADNYDTYEIPRGFGVGLADQVCWAFPLESDPTIPIIYNGGDPIGGLTLPARLTINIAAAFLDGLPSEWAEFDVTVSYAINPLGDYNDITQRVTGFYDGISWTPIEVLIPPVIFSYDIQVCLSALEVPGMQVFLDAATLTGEGDYEPQEIPCDPVDDLVVMWYSDDMMPILKFTAPQNGIYTVYSTTYPNHDGNPPGPDWLPEGSILGAAGEELWWEGFPTEDLYKNYIVVAECESTPPIPPENDNCENAIAVTEGMIPYTTINATTDGRDEPEFCDFASYSHIESDVWFLYFASCSGLA
ncbi:hypothetical protein KKH18_04680, partial [bacterium]|nr:hypothetical protein [bacterium]